jgi:hypothetical protein
MSAYKKLNQQDAYISTYTARKSWIASGSQYRELGINNIVGLSGSGDFYSLSSGNVKAGNSQTNDSTLFNRRLIYESLNHLYYSTFTQGINTTSSSYENYLQSSFEVSGSRKINERVSVFSIPKEVYGTHIEPLSVQILPDYLTTDSQDNYIEDNYATNLGVDSILAEDNLYFENRDYLFGTTGASCVLSDPDYILEESNYVNETTAGGGQYLDTEVGYRNCNNIVDDGEGRLYLQYSSPRYYVGNVIYTHGQIIITDEIIAMYYNHYFNAVLRWKSNLPIYTHNFHCKIKSGEFNHTLNKTVLDNINGDISSTVSGPDFQPYITTIGLYNDSNELIAVAKTGRPIPKSAETDMSVVVKLDMNFSSDRLLGGRGSEFIPFDPYENILNPPLLQDCVYHFTVRNYYKKSGRRRLWNGIYSDSNDRITTDNGDYALYRKLNQSVLISESVDTTENYIKLIDTSIGKTGMRSFCYVDITVTKLYNINKEIYYEFDFPTYTPANLPNDRQLTFFRDIIRTYLLENQNNISCQFTNPLI